MNPDIAAASAQSVSLGLMPLVIALVVYLFYSYCQFLLAKKMGVANAWMAFIPVLSAYLLIKMGGKPGWWLILMFIPFVNIVIAIMVIHEISKARGYGVGMTLGILFLGFIFFPVLAFSGSDTSKVA